MSRSCLAMSIVALAAACNGSSERSDSAAGLDSVVPGAGGSAVSGAGGSVVPGAGGSALPGAGGSAVPGAGGSAVPGAGGSAVPGAGGSAVPGAGGSEAGDSAVPSGNSRDAVPDCRVDLDKFVCNGTTNACCSPTLQQMRSPSTCSVRELRYIESCAGGVTSISRSFGTSALTCYYDTVSGQLVGANRSSDIAHECGRDAAAGELPVCDSSTVTEAAECRPDSGVGDAPADLAIEKLGPDAALDRAYPIDATPPEVYPGLEAGVKLCPDWSSQVYRPCCPATPLDCTGKPDGYPGYLCAQDCANYGDEGQGCGAAWSACGCQNERWVCLG